MVSFPGDSTATLVLLIFFTATVSSVPESSGFPSAPTLPTPHTDRLLVGITFVHAAAEIGAVCLDGSPPAYHLHRGFGSGAENWLLQFEGGGWCNDVESCLSRANTRRGSSSYMNRWEVFNGILSSRSALNPDFYNWNRVKIRYCDGASFAADSEFYNGTARLYFRGQRIWRAIVADLLSKGMINAKKALLSGCSAGGLSAILHCDDYANLLPRNTSVKCLSDGGFFLDAKDVSGSYTMRSFFEGVVLLQDVTKNLARECTSVQDFPAQCFFPQYQLAYIHTPMFILNTAYDIFQFNHILVPPSADPHGSWRNCKGDPNACTLEQIAPLQDFRDEMLTALTPLLNSTDGGIFVNSCFTHCQSEFQETWFSSDSPRLNNKTIAQSVGDWYFGREIIKETDCPYPCDETCYNPPPQEDTGR